jgi:hypothetical protein
VEVKLHSILTSALDGSEWSALGPSLFRPQLVGGLERKGAGLEVLKPFSLPGIEMGFHSLKAQGPPLCRLALQATFPLFYRLLHVATTEIYILIHHEIALM